VRKVCRYDVNVSVNLKIFNVARIAELSRSPRRRSIEPQNYVRKRLTKKEYFKTLTGQTGRDADDWVSDGNELHCR